MEDPRELVLFERAARLYRERADVRGEAEALFWIGCFHQVVRRDDQTAVPTLERSRELAARVGDKSTMSEALRHLGIAEHRAGHLDGARERLRSQPGCAREIGLMPGVAADMVGQAYIAAADDRRDYARTLLARGGRDRRGNRRPPHLAPGRRGPRRPEVTPSWAILLLRGIGHSCSTRREAAERAVTDVGGDEGQVASSCRPDSRRGRRRPGSHPSRGCRCAGGRSLVGGGFDRPRALPWSGNSITMTPMRPRPLQNRGGASWARNRPPNGSRVSCRSA